MRLPVSIIVFIVAACTCSQAAIAETSHEKLMHDGKERSFLLSVPADASSRKAMPLVIAAHPYPATGSVMATLSGFSAVAEREGFIVAYPEGIDGGFNALSCCGSEDDVGFISAIIDNVAAARPIDRSRIYATGISNGADLTYRLAVQLPGVFAAIAPVSGGMTGGWMQMPSGNLPSKPVSLITFYGGHDKYHAVFDATKKFWFEKLGCSTAVSTVEGNIQLTEGTCSDGSSAKAYFLPDMGHDWPGGPASSSMGYAASPVNATELIWEFFRAHPKG